MSLSRGQTSLSAETWQETKLMEIKRKQRLPDAALQNAWYESSDFSDCAFGGHLFKTLPMANFRTGLDIPVYVA